MQYVIRYVIAYVIRYVIAYVMRYVIIYAIVTGIRHEDMYLINLRHYIIILYIGIII